MRATSKNPSKGPSVNSRRRIVSSQRTASLHLRNRRSARRFWAILNVMLENLRCERALHGEYERCDPIEGRGFSSHIGDPSGHTVWRAATPEEDEVTCLKFQTAQRGKPSPRTARFVDLSDVTGNHFTPRNCTDSRRFNRGDATDAETSRKRLCVHRVPAV